MRRVLSIIFLLLSSSSGLSLAQAGSIGVFADPQGTSCDLDNTSGSMDVYCVHVDTPGATACRFRVEVEGAPLTYFGESSPFVNTYGNSQGGFGVSYGTCLKSPIHVLTISYSGVSAACDMIRVVDDPTAIPPGIYVTSCQMWPNPFIASGGAAYINNDGSCPCNIPVEQTTWGKVKALYQ